MTDREATLEFIKRLDLKEWPHDAYDLPGGYYHETYSQINFALSHPGVRSYSQAEWAVIHLMFDRDGKIIHRSGWGKTRR